MQEYSVSSWELQLKTATGALNWADGLIFKTFGVKSQEQ